MATNPAFCAIVPEVLIEENYATWSVCIQNYLLSQDLWDIVEKKSTTGGLEWRKKNAMALHGIQISCGSKLLHDIMGYKSAKEAWDFLACKCSPQIQGGSELASSSSVQDLDMAKKAVCRQPIHKLNSASSRTDWLNSITKATRTNQSQTLMRIPPMLRIEKFKTCYEPRVVSIGPYHHNCNPRLQQVEELKPFIAKKFVHLLTESEDVFEFFDRFEEKFDKIINPSIKGLYDENVTKDIDEEEFKQMMFVDGCFILYFIFCFHFYEVKSVGLKNRLIALVKHDLFLVENQLPFQVLKMLMSLTYFRSTGMEMFEKFTENTIGVGEFGQKVRMEESLHLLDILWIKLLGNNEETKILVENKNHNKRHLFHGVKELIAAGIHIRLNSSASLRDIKFRSCCIAGMLTLPLMTIERSTRQMLLNLTAHEACMDNPEKFGFTSYICFLDLLIDDAEDVQPLRTAGILENCLDSDEEVAKLFNEIASDLLPVVDTYEEVKYKIRDYLRHKRRVKVASWVTEVIRDHFKSPWRFIALLAGFIVIYFTIFPRSN